MPRRRVRDARERVLIYAPDRELRAWIEHELFGEPVSTSVVDTLSDVVASLTLVPPPWPRCLIADARAITSIELEMLSTIRAAGWAGTVIAIGDASRETQRALGIDLIVERTLACEDLRNALKHVGLGRHAARARHAARSSR